jgi:hypothetical protein
LKQLKPVTFVKVLKTVAVANVKLLANLLAKQVAALLTKSAKTQKKANKLKK